MYGADLPKRWTRILPAAFITYSLAYLDRSNYGFGAAAGMAGELHISQQRSALLGAMFFLGYTFLQIPGTAYAAKHSARRLIFVALLAWGTFSALTGVIRNFWLLAADRLLLGAAESFVFPAMLVLLTRWFTRAERSRATAFLMLGNPVTVLWMSAVTGFLIRAQGWRTTFVLEGSISIVWAFVWLVTVSDTPKHAKWMGESSREVLRRELEHEQQSLPGVPNLRTAFSFPNVPRLCVQYFFWSLGVYGFVLWLPVVISNASGLPIHITGLLVAAPYLFAAIGMVVVARSSDRAKQRKPYIWPLLMLSGAALGASCLLAPHSFAWTYVFVVIAGAGMYAPYGPFFAIVPEMLPRNVAGGVMALINSCGALGGFAGTYLVGLLQAWTGGSRAGFMLMSFSLVVSGIILAGMRPSPQEARA
ncbi:MFS transporter [Terracidiphilus gabretensis]|jgi:sugar phosphate permease|uniref:MFS transporter n=1 Tax=Terracidiphilus gabretensis TaxID=1577687 RepID=UPI00071B5132|nr:MFS transporter [Terracidiphilus gabretensis]